MKLVPSRELVARLAARDARAERELVARYTAHVRRIIIRMAGRVDLDDLVQDVFARVLRRVAEIRDPDGLAGFVSQTAVFVATEALRSRRRKAWLVLLDPEDLRDVGGPWPSDEIRAACAALRALIDELEPEARVVFRRRHIDGMDLAEVAAACGISLSTVKRRLTSAEVLFEERAQSVPELEPWVLRSPRWCKRTK